MKSCGPRWPARTWIQSGASTAATANVKRSRASAYVAWLPLSETGVAGGGAGSVVGADELGDGDGDAAGEPLAWLVLVAVFVSFEESPRTRPHRPRASTRTSTTIAVRSSAGATFLNRPAPRFRWRLLLRLS